MYGSKGLAAALVLSMALVSDGTNARSINAGDREFSASTPFVAAAVAEFDTPWALAFLPDGKMVVTEKPGRMFLVDQSGHKIEISNVPNVVARGQNGLLDVALSPDFSNDRQVYITYVEPGSGDGGLALARATLSSDDSKAGLDDLKVLWRQTPKGRGGQPGGIIAFDPEGSHLFLTSGDRMRPQTAQDPEQALGKVLRFNLDGTVPDDNPQFAAGGVQARTWTLGHRIPTASPSRRTAGSGSMKWVRAAVTNST